MGRKDGVALTTKRVRIAIAVDSLCTERELDSLSIDDICQRAGVSRSSFYRAFGSKYDIAIWCQTFPLLQGIGNMGRTRTCIEGLSFSFGGLALFKNLIRSSKGSPEMSLCDEQSRELVGAMIKETLRDFHDEEVDGDLAFQVDWVVAAGMIMAQDWMSESLDKTPGEMARLIEQSYPSHLRDLLNHPVERSESASLDASLMGPLLFGMGVADEPMQGQRP